jgi:uncharacterized protein (TIGR02588 family)
MNDRDDSSGGPRIAGSSPGELALGVLGGLVTLVLLGFLAYQALAVREAAPRLGVEVVAIEPAPPGFVARVQVRNDGGQNAQTVHISGTVSSGGAVTEEATATIDYVAPNSSDEVALVFGVEPGSGDLDVRVTGYALP